MAKTSLSKKFMAWCLSKADEADRKAYGERKKRLFSELKGNVIEIGPGAGVNLGYYPKEIRLIGIEPNPEMRKLIRKKAKKLNFRVEIKELKAEKLPLKSNSVDFAISTLVLCSVDNPNKVLLEIKRVLKKGGTFLFIEHVADKKGTIRRILQDIAPHTPWKFFSDNCRPNRETWKIIDKVGFRNVKIEYFCQKKFRFNPLAFLIRPHIIGTAEK